MTPCRITGTADVEAISARPCDEFIAAHSVIAAPLRSHRFRCCGCCFSNVPASAKTLRVAIETLRAPFAIPYRIEP